MAKKEPLETPVQEEVTAVTEPTELEKVQELLNQEKDSHLRVLAEYDNFRKRSQKEREALYTEIKAETVAKFLPVFDNLLRALEQPTEDSAYKKGVEMTMNGLREVMEKLGVEEYGTVGDIFDPQYHNAVMHEDSDDFGENTICEVFQKGFKLGEKVIRFAMVTVAN